MKNEQDKYLALLHDVYNGEQLDVHLTYLHQVNYDCISQAKQLGYIDRYGYSLFQHKPNIRSANKLIEAIHNDKNKYIGYTNNKPKKKTKITLLWGLITIWK